MPSDAIEKIKHTYVITWKTETKTYVHESGLDVTSTSFQSDLLELIKSNVCSVVGQQLMLSFI